MQSPDLGPTPGPTTGAPVPVAASTLVADVLTRSPAGLHEVVRTRVSVHYETGDPDVPVLCVALPSAVRLPNAVLVAALPAGRPPAWRVSRWWRPARPRGLTIPGRLPAGLARTSYDELWPDQMVGRGAGLTPDGDDVLAGALVAAHATGDTRLGAWRAHTLRALGTRRTTAVSRALLRHACDGYAVPELADALTALCCGTDAGAAVARLRAVGHSSGQSLLDGAVHVLATATPPVLSGPVHEGAA